MKPPRYTCRLCGGSNVQGTQPAWFRLNESDSDPVEIDTEAEYYLGFCEDCNVARQFDELIKERS